MMTRARRQRRCLADTGSGFSKTGDPEPEVSEWRDWANLTTVFIEDIAGRLLSVDVSEYLRFRAVCQPWRDLTDDPRALGVLEARFRPRNWIPLSKQAAPPSRLRLRNIATGARLGLDLPVLVTSHLLGYVDGLFVLCDKATGAILLLHPFTGTLVEFPIIHDVPDHSGTRVGIDAFRPRFPSQRTALTRAGIDESTSPPTLQLPLWDEAWLVLLAKPGDAHWVPLYPPCMSMNQEMGMLRYTYLCAGQPLHQRVSVDESILEMYDPLELGSSVKIGQIRPA